MNMYYLLQKPRGSVELVQEDYAPADEERVIEVYEDLPERSSWRGGEIIRDAPWRRK